MSNLFLKRRHCLVITGNNLNGGGNSTDRGGARASTTSDRPRRPRAGAGQGERELGEEDHDSLGAGKDSLALEARNLKDSGKPASRRAQRGPGAREHAVILCSTELNNGLILVLS